MTDKNLIAPEARQALADFKMEMSKELDPGITSNSLTEYPLSMNGLDPEDISMDNELPKHYL